MPKAIREATGYGSTRGQQLNTIRAHLKLDAHDFIDFLDLTTSTAYILATEAGRLEACHDLVASIRSTWSREDTKKYFYANEVGHTHCPFALYRLLFVERKNKHKRDAEKRKREMFDRYLIHTATSGDDLYGPGTGPGSYTRCWGQYHRGRNHRL